jgi:hypothetical protein
MVKNACLNVNIADCDADNKAEGRSNRDEGRQPAQSNTFSNTQGRACTFGCVGWDGRQCEVLNAHSPVTPSTVTRHKHPVAAASSGKRCIRMHVGLTSTRLSPSPCFRPGQDMFRWGGNGSSSSTKTADSDSVPFLIVKKGGRGDGEGDGEGECVRVALMLLPHRSDPLICS